MPEISIKAEEILRIGGFPLTNSLLLAFVTVGLLIIFSIALKRRLNPVPGRLQGAFELVLEEFLKIMDAVLGSRSLSIRYLPFVVTIFLFIVVSNWLGLMPIVGSLVAKAHGTAVPLFRSPASDLNFTAALAIVSVVGVNLLGVKRLGFIKHFSKFFDFSNPLRLFIGLLEFAAEFVKILSFSFRLFGNVFAGEVLLLIVGFLTPYLLPLPFLFLEIFVGFIQAFIFSMLTLVFVAMAVHPHT